MDPRHPEQAISRLGELFEQYKRVMSDMESCTSSSRLGALEREGGLVVQELCLVAPRLHDAMIAASRDARKAIASGRVIPADYLKEPTLEAVEKYTEDTIEHYVAPNQAETVIVEPNYRKKKKTTRKKKTEE